MPVLPRPRDPPRRMHHHCRPIAARRCHHVPHLVILLLLLILGHNARVRAQTAQQQELPEECRPPTPDVILEPFVPEAPIADIIFVIDTSGSMKVESEYLIDNINAFGRHLNASGIDYRVVLVGQHNSWLCVEPPLAASSCAIHGPRFLHVEQVVDSWNALPTLVNRPTGGTAPDGRHSSVSGTYVWSDAQPQLGQVDGKVLTGWADFLRPEAAKTFVLISDDDSSNSFYGRFAKSAQPSASDPPSACWAAAVAQGAALDGSDGLAGRACALQWKQDLLAVDTQNLFTPTDKLPQGFAFHAITAHNDQSCAQQWGGYQQSFTYVGLTEIANGSVFNLCATDWSPYFNTIAAAVEDTTVSAACDHNVPRSSSDASLLAGNLEPDTPFELNFAYECSACSSGAAEQLVITKSSAGGGTLCPADGGGNFYKVDDVSDPRSVTLCGGACDTVKDITITQQAQGNLSFTFRPVAKLASVTVSGRGAEATALFGPPQQLRPSLTFPSGHPALLRGDCGGPAARPTIPVTGPALFSGGTCPAASGVDLFYALNPISGRSETFASGSGAGGVTIFFFVNALGESYFGIQIGNYDAASMPTGATSGGPDYSVVDVILSGTAVSSGASWVIQDGKTMPSDYISPSSTTGRGRVKVANFAGKTAGGVLGPLPSYDYCIDVVIVEASRSVDFANIVDFIPRSGGSGGSSRLPAVANMSFVNRDVFDAGGLRFCADACTGASNTGDETSVRCYTEKDGTVKCPDGIVPPGEGDSSGGGNGNSTDPIAPPAASSAEDDMSGLSAGAAIGIAVGVSVLILGSVVLFLVAHRRKQKRRAGNTGAGKKQPPAIALTSIGADKETGVGSGRSSRRKTRKSICGSKWDVVVDPESGDQYYYNPATGESSWTMPEQVEQRVQKSKRRTTVAGLCGSAWDLVEDPQSGYQYWWNESTGEASWSVPDAVHMHMPSQSMQLAPTTAAQAGIWVSFQTVDGYTAYASETTGEVVWDLPEGAVLRETESSSGAGTQHARDWESFCVPEGQNEADFFSNTNPMRNT